jgi:predicted ribosome quality control (RQC) complex YloA/Tae2 family protein
MRIEYNKTLFVVGKSAEENWKIILDAEKDYYWVHASDVPSAHVIIEIDKPLDEEIQYACQLCKTQTKKIKDVSIEYVVTQVKNIKLGSKAGQVYFRDTSKVSIVTLNN